MATGAQVRAKILATLGQLEATPRSVKLREVTVTGGDALLGLGGTITNTDTDVDPLPAVEMVAADEITGPGGILQPGDYRFIFDGTISEDVLRNRQILYGTEVLHIVQCVPYALNQVVVAWEVIARTLTART